MGRKGKRRVAARPKETEMGDTATLPPEDQLKPAAELAAVSKTRWAGESADYRRARATLLTYLWMYGPERERPCPMCTSFVGSLDVPAPDIGQRLALAIVGRSPVARQLAFARERGWRNLRFYQAIDEQFVRDTHWVVDGDEGAGVLVWTRDGADV